VIKMMGYIESLNVLCQPNLWSVYRFCSGSLLSPSQLLTSLNVISLDLMLLSNMTGTFHLVITLVDARRAWNLSKSPLLSCLRQFSYGPLHYVLILGSPPCWF
jgi:hypothetical protein